MSREVKSVVVYRCTKCNEDTNFTTFPMECVMTATFSATSSAPREQKDGMRCPFKRSTESKWEIVTYEEV